MMSDKKLEKIEKILGTKKESLDSAQGDELQTAIVQANQSIKTAQEELEANPIYQELKENLKAVSEGLKEVKKFQNATIQYSLHLLEERGQK